MHIVIKNKKSTIRDTPKKNGTQQKKHPLMLFENNDTLQKWRMTKTPPEIDKYDTHKKWSLTKMALCKKMSKGYFSRAELSDF